APYPVLEIIKKGINKAVGVDYARSYLDIPQKNTIAFGDEDNDTEMLQYVEHGVAMKNGIDDIKAISKYVRSEERRVGKEWRSWWRVRDSSRRRHTRSKRDWSSDVCSSDLNQKRN